MEETSTKTIDKTEEWDNNVITLIKHFIKDKTKEKQI